MLLSQVAPIDLDPPLWVGPLLYAAAVIGRRNRARCLEVASDRNEPALGLLRTTCATP